MPRKFFVPKFITIEDRLAGLITMKQLFALLIAFLTSYFLYKIYSLLGIISGIISFSIAILGFFWNVNGKPFFYVLPSAINSFLGEKYIWKRIERLSYKEIEVPETEEKEVYPEFIEPRKKTLLEAKEVEIEIKYPEIVPSFKETVKLELDKPLSLQKNEFEKLTHKHEINPHNPYRLFPYIKFYQRKSL